jgi:1-acyl-sn-glycerol-3-phosphate acyltransferase
VHPTRRLLGTLLGFLHAWLVARFRAPRLGPQARGRLARALAKRALARLRIRVRVHGRPPGDAACLLVANHVSWLDVQVLSAMIPARFVAKLETRGWPVIGAIAAAFGTFFIRRGSCRDAARVKDAVAHALSTGETVVVFPEGTTTDGTRLLRFRPAFFQAAIDAGVSVHPIALRYRRPDGSPSQATSFVGDMTFLQSLTNVAREPALVAEVSIGPAIPSPERGRRALAAIAQRSIAGALGLPPAAVEPALPIRRPATRSGRRAA